MKKVILLLAIMFSAFAHQGEISNIITPRGIPDPEAASKEIIKEFYKVFSTNDSRELNKILSPNYTVYDSTVLFDSSYSKYDAFSKNLEVRMRALHEALPNFKLKIIEMVAEGNKILARIEIQGVQKGPFLGVEPTDKPVIIKGFTVFTISGGKIIYVNEMWNEFSIMKQIGYIVL